MHIWPHFSLLQAIEESPRPINKKAVVRDLETILAQEIHLGYLVKVILSCPSAQQNMKLIFINSSERNVIQALAGLN